MVNYEPKVHKENGLSIACDASKRMASATKIDDIDDVLRGMDRRYICVPNTKLISMLQLYKVWA